MKTLASLEHRESSQNGEDGLIAWLVSRVVKPTRTFVEIGCSDGLKNNTTALVQRGWTGVAIDCLPNLIDAYHDRFPHIDARCMFVTPHQYPVLPSDPDLFSLDIDGFDWHVARALLEHGFRPKVVVVEYNAGLGAERSLTVPYLTPNVDLGKRTRKFFYFGASIEAWKRLWGRYGYQFVTVESAGINAFFVLGSACLPPDVDGLSWVDGQGIIDKYGPADARWQRVCGLPWMGVT